MRTMTAVSTAIPVPPDIIPTVVRHNSSPLQKGFAVRFCVVLIHRSQFYRGKAEATLPEEAAIRTGTDREKFVLDPEFPLC
jgi:hypothetical protein